MSETGGAGSVPVGAPTHTVNATWVRDVAALGQDDVAQAGGKGARLGELARLGLPVPPGFVLLTSAYATFIAANELDGAIAGVLVDAGPRNPAGERMSAAIRERFLSSAMPEAVATALRTAYAALGGGAVAVRSSAMAEDLPEASFAGQHDTLLNVVGEVALLAAVRRCWASLWTARVLTYRAERGLAADGMGMAVVVQRMVPAEAAGVLFTAHPVTGRTDEMLINATWGLGEALVSGHVAPDSITVEAATGRMLRYDVGAKEAETLALAGGGTHEQVVAPERRARPALDGGRIAELARLGRVVEAHFGAPQDIEWVSTPEGIVLVQVRPITTPAAERAPRGPGWMPAPGDVPGDDDWPGTGATKPVQPYDLWTRVNVGENLPHPVTPLTLSSFVALFAGMEADGSASGPFADGETEIARRWYGRVYFNEGAVRHLVARFGLPATLLDRVWGTRGRPDPGAARRFRPLRFVRRLPALLALARPKRPSGAARQPKPPKRSLEQRFAAVDGWVSEFRQRDLHGLSDRALWDELTGVWRPRYAEAFQTHVGASLGAVMAYLLLERAAGWRGGDKTRAHDLVTGLAGIRSAAIGPALARMAATLAAAGLADIACEQPPAVALARLQATPEARPFLAQLDTFLADHGHRCADEVELLHPRWAEAPELVVDLVAGYLRAGPALDPDAAEAAACDRRVAMTQAVARRLDPLRRAIFRRLLARAQRAVRRRDNSRDSIAKAGFPLRHLVAELGRRWAARGWLGAPDDVFFLVEDEVAALVLADAAPAGLPATVVAPRREAYDFWFTVVAPDVLGPDGHPVATEQTSGPTIIGLAASGGRVQGRARVVLDPREAGRVLPGDILVARATDPGWTPVFPLVRAVVLEIGGQLSHGAIVAREYGIPAVVNATDATRRIRNGQTITVDGDTGRVALE